MALLSMFAGGRTKATDLPRDGGPVRSDVFVPRRAPSSDGLPANTRMPSVLGAQPATFARGREVAALLFWTLAVFFSFALASYQGDPALAPGAPDAPASADWVGPVGAFVARAFVSLV